MGENSVLGSTPWIPTQSRVGGWLTKLELEFGGAEVERRRGSETKQDQAKDPIWISLDF
jgi:hypothetical protein